jgi:hypothetical protein
VSLTVLVLSAGGPFIAMAGAILLAYDIFRGPLRDAMRTMLTAQFQAADEIHAGNIGRYRALPAHLDRDTVETWVQESMQAAERDRTQAQARNRAFEERELATAFRLALIGLLLVAVGSLMQTGAAILSFLEAGG